MKYNTIIVPVMASFVALAAAAATEPKSDQGAYRPYSEEPFPKSPAPVRESVGRTPAGSEQGDVTPAPARKPASKVPQPDNVSSEAMENAEDLHPDPASAPSEAKDRTEGARPPNVHSETKDKVEGTHPANVPSQVMRKTQGAHPADITDKAPKPVREQYPSPQSLRMRRSRIHAGRSEVSEPCGIIHVQASDPAYSGYISEQRDANGRYTVVSDKSEAIVTKIKAHNIVPSNGEGYDVLGATFGAVHDEAGEEKFRGNSRNFAMLTGTSKTLYGKGPSAGRSSFNDAVGANQRIESAVYQLSENGEIHPSWVDKDGVSTPATWGVNDQMQLVYSSNIGEYVADFGGKSAQAFCLY